MRKKMSEIKKKSRRIVNDRELAADHVARPRTDMVACKTLVGGRH